ncbi:hypothetical protein DICVIV_07877 [Dictyocaulus viviparus]|uniref:Uncharacterized protein n=1 Tax=Dictyocaulus viviparus TaxID=29172 RepID=A0A0D8XQN5_DICVI|nr:hypothetical protein DICVIV_07877 [Dictyocaulus viviparus]
MKSLVTSVRREKRSTCKKSDEVEQAGIVKNKTVKVVEKTRQKRTKQADEKQQSSKPQCSKRRKSRQHKRRTMSDEYTSFEKVAVEIRPAISSWDTKTRRRTKKSGARRSNSIPKTPNACDKKLTKTECTQQKHMKKHTTESKCTQEIPEKSKPIKKVFEAEEDRTQSSNYSIEEQSTESSEGVDDIDLDQISTAHDWSYKAITQSNTTVEENDIIRKKQQTTNNNSYHFDVSLH